MLKNTNIENLILELIFIIGLSIVLYTNFKINEYLGLYSTGFILIIYSIYSLKN